MLFYNILLFCIGIIVWIASDNPMILDLSVIVFGLSRSKIDDVLMLSLVVESITVASIIAASQFGLIYDYVWIAGDRVRHGLGFLYCTLPSHLYLNIVALYLYVRRKDIGVVEYIVLCILNYMLYSLTDSRNSFLLVYLLIALWIVGNKLPITIRNTIKLKSQVTAASMFVICAAISLIATCLYSPDVPVWNTINDSLSNRIDQTAASLDRYGVTLFGQKIEFIGNGIIPSDPPITEWESNPDADMNVVDNSYMRALINWGLIPTAVLIGLLSLEASYFTKVNKYFLVIILLIFAFHGIFDQQLFDLHYNSFLLYFSPTFLYYSKSEGKV